MIQFGAGDLTPNTIGNTKVILEPPESLEETDDVSNPKNSINKMKLNKQKICKICSKPCDNLRKHKKDFHKKGRKVCDLCEKTCNSLLKHMKKFHKKKFCKICSGSRCPLLLVLHLRLRFQLQPQP